MEEVMKKTVEVVKLEMRSTVYVDEKWLPVTIVSAKLWLFLRNLVCSFWSFLQSTVHVVVHVVTCLGRLTIWQLSKSAKKKSFTSLVFWFHILEFCWWQLLFCLRLPTLQTLLLLRLYLWALQFLSFCFLCSSDCTPNLQKNNNKTKRSTEITFSLCVFFPFFFFCGSGRNHSWTSCLLYCSGSTFENIKNGQVKWSEGLYIGYFTAFPVIFDRHSLCDSNKLWHFASIPSHQSNLSRRKKFWRPWLDQKRRVQVCTLFLDFKFCVWEFCWDSQQTEFKVGTINTPSCLHANKKQSKQNTKTQKKKKTITTVMCSTKKRARVIEGEQYRLKNHVNFKFFASECDVLTSTIIHPHFLLVCLFFPQKTICQKQQKKKKTTKDRLTNKLKTKIENVDKIGTGESVKWIQVVPPRWPRYFFLLWFLFVCLFSNFFEECFVLFCCVVVKNKNKNKTKSLQSTNCWTNKARSEKKHISTANKQTNKQKTN